MGAKATRRELVKAGIGVAAGLGAWQTGVGVAAAATTSQSQALGYALQIERLAAIIYRQVLGTNALASAARSELTVLLSEEEQHVGRLERLLRGLGGPRPAGPSSVAEAQALLTQHQIHRSITNIPTQHDALRVLVDVESLTEGAYFEAMPVLQGSAVIRMSAELMGSDAQHWTILSGIQHHGDVMISVPYPFVQGSP